MTRSLLSGITTRGYVPRHGQHMLNLVSHTSGLEGKAWSWMCAKNDLIVSMFSWIIMVKFLFLHDWIWLYEMSLMRQEWENCSSIIGWISPKICGSCFTIKTNAFILVFLYILIYKLIVITIMQKTPNYCTVKEYIFIIVMGKYYCYAKNYSNLIFKTMCLHYIYIYI